MAETLFIVNPNAGRTRKTWRDLLPRLSDWVRDYSVIMTHEADDLTDILKQARLDEVKTIITVGGDGTNKYFVNALMEHQRNFPAHELIFGSIPAGTGRDFVRGQGLPLKSVEAAKYVLTKAKPRLIDLGLARFGDESHYFLNISSAGIANDISNRVEASSKRPWSFLFSILASLAGYQPETMQIQLDGEDWFEGNIYFAAVANGRAFGQGILIAPDAMVDDGLFDVVIAEEMPFLQLVQAFPTLYTGKHITHPKVKVQRAKQVRISNPTGERLGLDFDGEPIKGVNSIVYEIVPAALNILL